MPRQYQSRERLVDERGGKGSVHLVETKEIIQPRVLLMSSGTLLTDQDLDQIDLDSMTQNTLNKPSMETNILDAKYMSRPQSKEPSWDGQALKGLGHYQCTR